MKPLDELQVEETTPTATGAWCKQTMKQIQRRPLQAVAQAALAGYALRFLPVRRILSGALRLVVPGIFLAGLYQVSKSLPSSIPGGTEEWKPGDNR